MHPTRILAGLNTRKGGTQLEKKAARKIKPRPKSRNKRRLKRRKRPMCRPPSRNRPQGNPMDAVEDVLFSGICILAVGCVPRTHLFQSPSVVPCFSRSTRRRRLPLPKRERVGVRVVCGSLLPFFP